MNSPEEKAKELIDKFAKTPLMLKETDVVILTKEIAKQCALIAVDEILNKIESLNKPEYTTFVQKWGDNPETMDGYERKDYWQEVKSAITKI